MIDSINKLKDTLEDSLLQPNVNANIDKSERIISLVTGAFIFSKGIGNLFSHPLLALSEAGIGAFLLQRGVTGHCMLKEMTEEPKQEVRETILFSGQQNQPQTQAMPDGSLPL